MLHVVCCCCFCGCSCRRCGCSCCRCCSCSSSCSCRCCCASSGSCMFLFLFLFLRLLFFFLLLVLSCAPWSLWTWNCMLRALVTYSVLCCNWVYKIRQFEAWVQTEVVYIGPPHCKEDHRDAADGCWVFCSLPKRCSILLASWLKRHQILSRWLAFVYTHMYIYKYKCPFRAFTSFVISGSPSWHAEISRILTWHGLCMAAIVALGVVGESFIFSGRRVRRSRRYWQQKVAKDSRLIGRQGARHKAETAWTLNMIEIHTVFICIPYHAFRYLYKVYACVKYMLDVFDVFVSFACTLGGVRWYYAGVFNPWDAIVPIVASLHHSSICKAHALGWTFQGSWLEVVYNFLGSSRSQVLLHGMLR